MLEDAKITFFEIKSCGYYSPGPKTKLQFGDIASTLADLHSWSSGKDIGQTKTFEPSPEHDSLPVYLYDIRSHKMDWLLTVWNQTPATDNKVASVMANGRVGSASVKMNVVAPGSIPGFATYFWFIPERNVFANLRFQHNTVGHAPMRSYLRGFLERSSQHVVYDTAPQAAGVDLGILGYRKSHSDPIQGGVQPRFNSQPFKKPGEMRFISSNYRNISKVKRRITLELHNQEDLELWQKFWRKLKGSPASARDYPIAIEYNIKSSISSDELKDIFEAFTKEIESDSTPTWDDYGFQLRGETATRWLSSAYARDKLELNISRENDEVVTADSLLLELSRNRNKILSILD